MCIPCSPNCLTCSTSPTRCNSCAANSPQAFLSSNYTCVSGCLSTQLNNGTHCLPCSSNCRSCSGSISFCTACAALEGCSISYLNSAGRCVCTCQISEFSPDGMTCQPCDAACRTCISYANKCTTCNELSPYPYFLRGRWACLSACPITHFASDTNECLLCSPNCMTCSGTASNCTSCSVSDPALSYLSWNGSCVSMCARGEVSIQQTCYRCRPPCKECTSSADYCSECLTGVSHKGRCYDACPSETYSQNGRCEACPKNCVECLNAYSCSKAKPPYLVSSTGEVVQSCLGD